MKRFLHCLSCALCLLLTSCSESKGLSAQEVFDFEGCSTMCWAGLVPGSSTQRDVEALLSRKDPLTILVSQSRKDSTCQHWELGIENNDHMFDRRLVAVENDKVNLIRSESDIRLSLQEVISRFGEPEYAQASLARGPDGVSPILAVYYPSAGLAFDLSADLDTIGAIRPRTPVERVLYFPPGDLVSYLEVEKTCLRGIEGNESWVAHRLTLFQPWKGYGQLTVTETQ